MVSGSDSVPAGNIAGWPFIGSRQRRLPFHVHIATLFSLLIIGAGGAIGWHNHIQNRELIISASQELVQAITAGVPTKVSGIPGTGIEDEA